MRDNGKFIKPEDIPALVAKLKQEGKKIVLNTGVYDMPHEGHIEYLYKSKDQGDVLIVGLNTDDLTRKEKGPNRPVIKQEARKFIVAALECVDYVTYVDIGPDKNELTKIIRPDVRVISESTRENSVDFLKRMQERIGEYCGKIVLLPPQAVTSTSNQILTLVKEGNVELLAELVNAFGPIFERHGFIFKKNTGEKEGGNGS